MKTSTTSTAIVPEAIVEEAWQDVSASFERLCLSAGIATLASMMEEDAAKLCGTRYGWQDGKAGTLTEKPRGSSVSTVPRSRSNGRGCALAMERSWHCRVGKRPPPAICSASGR